MFKTYFKIAFRNLTKHKKYSLINILSLSIGLAGFILIMLWVQDELSYDGFHQNADRIYMTLRTEGDKTSAITSKLLGPAIKSEIPEVIEATGYSPLPASFKPYLQYKNAGFEENFGLIDPQFFNIFSFKLIQGDPQTALNDPNSIVITQKMCEKYFGSMDVLDKSLTLTFLGQKRQMKVTGILENIPHNTQIQREIFIPIEFILSFGANWDAWQNYSVQTYILTNEKINQQELEKKILACETRNAANLNLGTSNYKLIPLKKIHLHTNNIDFFNSTGDIKYVYVFSIFAGILLLIACMNYINLTNALSLKRTKEIGIKKVVGAKGRDLILQYLGETLIVSLLALAISLILIEIFLPVLNNVSGKSLSVHYFSFDFLAVIFLSITITNLVSGIYPSLFVLKFVPAQILKGKFQNNATGSKLQKGLVIFQFTLSTIIIICTIVVLNQLYFIRNTNLGYNKENVVCLKVKGDISNQYDAFKNDILSHPEILSISRSEPLNVKALSNTGGITWPGKNKKFLAWLLHVDSDFAATYKIPLKEGRFYSAQSPSDATNAYVINEAAQKEMELENPIGKDLTVWDRPGKIIGVTKDFNFSSLHHVIEPLIFRIPDPEQKNAFCRELSVRIKSNTVQKSLTLLQNTWNSFFPDEAFDFYFFDEHLNAQYAAEQRMGVLFKYFSFMAIFIACFGLYGLTAFMIERKIKDIGIHKVLGAEMSNVVFLLSKQYIQWILIANAIAWPLAWAAMHKWLQNFAYRVNISWWVFALAGGLVMAIALTTVGWQVIKAAKVNPVKSLRYE